MQTFKIIITVASLVLIIITKSEIDFTNLVDNQTSLALTKEIIYDLSIGVFSAMILVWGIDEINEKNRIKEEQKRHNVIYKKIIPVVKAYYDFYVKLYIATRDNKVMKDDKVLESLFNVKDNYLTQIKKANPFYKEGFYADGNIDALEYMKNHNEFPKSLPWYKCWNIDNQNFTTQMRRIEQDFSFMIPADLHNKIAILLNLVEPINYISKFIEMKMPINIKEVELPPVLIMPLDFFIDGYKLIEILNALEDVMKYLSAVSNEDILKIDISYINERNTSPILGDALR